MGEVIKFGECTCVTQSGRFGRYQTRKALSCDCGNGETIIEINCLEERTKFDLVKNTSVEIRKNEPCDVSIQSPSDDSHPDIQLKGKGTHIIEVD